MIEAHFSSSCWLGFKKGIWADFGSSLDLVECAILGLLCKALEVACFTSSTQQLDLIFDLGDRKLSLVDQKWKFWMIIEELNKCIANIFSFHSTKMN